MTFFWIYFPEGTWLNFPLGRKLTPSNHHPSQCLEHVYHVQWSYGPRFSSSPGSLSLDLDAAWGSWWYSLRPHHRWHLVQDAFDTPNPATCWKFHSPTHSGTWEEGKCSQCGYPKNKKDLFVFTNPSKVNINYSLLRVVLSPIPALHFQEFCGGLTLNKCSSFSFPMSETEKGVRIYVEISLMQGRYSSGKCLHQRPLMLGDSSDSCSSLGQF